MLTQNRQTLCLQACCFLFLNFVISEILISVILRSKILIFRLILVIFTGVSSLSFQRCVCMRAFDVSVYVKKCSSRVGQSEKVNVRENEKKICTGVQE